MELRKYFKLNENKDATYQNLSNKATVALMGNLGEKMAENNKLSSQAARKRTMNQT